MLLGRCDWPGKQPVVPISAGSPQATAQGRGMGQPRPVCSPFATFRAEAIAPIFGTVDRGRTWRCRGTSRRPTTRAVARGHPRTSARH
jgi:hypothetical protein